MKIHKFLIILIIPFLLSGCSKNEKSAKIDLNNSIVSSVKVIDDAKAKALAEKKAAEEKAAQEKAEQEKVAQEEAALKAAEEQAAKDAAEKAARDAANAVDATNTPRTQTGGNKVVVIDPGHQRYGNNELEPIGPGATTTKPKVTTGTTGINSRIPESVIALDVSLKLKAELEARGYQVIMIRTSQDVNLSNRERADIANSSGGDIFIRIHCNGSDNTSVNGILTMAPTASNPYCPNIIGSSDRLSKLVLASTCATTGAKNKGVSYTDSMSGINWCQIPVTIIEMGFLSNPTEDTLLNDGNYQNKLVTGMANGIDQYFN